MDPKDLTIQKPVSPTRAKSFKVKTSNLDYTQYVNTIKAYALAGMPFEHIANAGDFLGDEVEKLEMDAPIQEGWKNTIGEIVEDQGKIMAWQTRGEVVSMSHQLSQPQTSGMEMVTITRDVVIQNEDQKIDVVEGIAVATKDNEKIENNIYLKSPANLDKIDKTPGSE